MSERLRIYVSGPMTGSGTLEDNVANAIAVSRELILKGYAPLCPHLSVLMDDPPIAHDTWLESDLAWVSMADAVIRLPGKSAGADMECGHAKWLGIPIYESLDFFWSHPPVKGDEGFHYKLRRLGLLHDKKQKDYGTDTDPFHNVRASGEWGVAPWVGAMVRLTDKVRRLQALAQKGELANEPAIDSFRDIAVYAIIAEILYECDPRTP